MSIYPELTNPFLTHLNHAKQALIVLSAPGTGKSKIVRELNTKYGLSCFDMDTIVHREPDKPNSSWFIDVGAYRVFRFLFPVVLGIGKNYQQIARTAPGFVCTLDTTEEVQREILSERSQYKPVDIDACVKQQKTLQNMYPVVNIKEIEEWIIFWLDMKVSELKYNDSLVMFNLKED